MMAEALCGPSNALQNFQKHTSVDRTLQQDRLRFHTPVEGFRSLSGSSTGRIDAQFEAFVNGSNALTQRTFLPPSIPSWAGDFQRLNLNQTRATPVPSSRFHHEAPLYRPQAASWHQEFKRQQSSAFHQQTRPLQVAQPMRWAPTMQEQYGAANPYLNNSRSFSAQQAPKAAAITTAMNDAMFEQEFGAAEVEIQKRDELAEPAAAEPTHKAPDYEPEAFDMSNACVEPGDVMGDFDYDNYLLQHGRFPDAPRTASSDIYGPEQSNRSAKQGPDQSEHTANPASSDDLSRTAGSLLDKLKDEHDDKFRNSNFLALMRQLRDREVLVDGDKIVDSTQALHPGGEFYPTQAPSTSSSDSLPWSVSPMRD